MMYGLFMIVLLVRDVLFLFLIDIEISNCHKIHNQHFQTFLREHVFTVHYFGKMLSFLEAF